MKIYVVIDEETGESDSLEYVASTLEKAIEYCQKEDQYLYERNVYETELDRSFGWSDPLYTQFSHKDGLFFLDKDGFKKPIEKYNK